MGRDDDQEKSGAGSGGEDEPKYTVYRAGQDRGRKAAAPTRGSTRQKEGADAGKPEYKVYRSRPGFISRLRGAADLSALREKLPGRGAPERPAPKPARAPSSRPTWRRVLRWAAIGAGLWLLLSLVLFAVSAQIQKSKLNDGAAQEVGALPVLAASGQTILVIGTDARPVGTSEPGADTREECVEQAAQGDPPSGGCSSFRADTLMLVRAGGGAFEKLSIPRDTYADIPGQGPQKINAAYAVGGAELQIQTVENFLGIDVDHVVILDFEGFADFIDALGGVEVALREPVKSKISGGASNGGITLKLSRGRHTLDGQRALALARTRQNLKNPGENDLQRAQRQQLILEGIKNRLTSPLRLPINFVRAPLIAWNAPKAMVTDMGALTLPQLVVASAIGGDSRTLVLGRNAGAGPAGSLLIPQSECRKAVRKLYGKNPDGTPVCSPGA